MIDLSIWKYIAGHSIWLVDFKEWKHHLKCLCLCIWQPQLLHKRGRLTHVMILLHIFSLVGRKSMKNCFHRLWYYLVLTPGPKSRVSHGGPGRRTWEENLGPGRRTGKPRCNPTCPAAAQLPFLQKFHPQPYGCLPGILTPWNLEILPTREKLILRMYKVKVAVVGPSQAGKTMISNFLADATENIGGEIGFCFCFM